MLFAKSIYWLALNLYHEARGEPLEGKVGVAHVTIARTSKRKLAVIDVVQQPHQFSWYSDGKPDDVDDHAAFIECFEAAFIAMDQRLQGNTFHGADHYHSVNVDPSWNRHMKKVAEIGNHIFYRA